MSIVFYNKDHLKELVYKNLPKEGKIELTQEYHYTDNRGNLHVIPKGFKSDGASIPQWLWTVAGTPFAPNVIRAAVVHDYLYSIKYDRKLADRIFHDILKEDGVNVVKRRAYKTGVNLFGWTRY